MPFLNRLLGRGKATRWPGGRLDDPLLINAYATVRDLPPLSFTHDLKGRRVADDPELAGHLAGFLGYVTRLNGGEMTPIRYHLCRHVQRVRNQVSLVATASSMPALEAWALSANAVLFLPDGSVRAPDMAVIVSPVGRPVASVGPPYPPDAVARRERSLYLLRGSIPTPPSSMPPSLGESEVVLRPAAEVFRRALALLFVAARAEARLMGTEPAPAGRGSDNSIGLDALTPREKVQVASGDLDVAIAARWRVEASNALAWSLGIRGACVSGRDRSRVDALWDGLMRHAVGGGDPDEPCLRPVDVMLDALDLTWREHWIARQRCLTGSSGAVLDGDVVAERHVALNWLTGFHNVPGIVWDDVETPT